MRRIGARKLTRKFIGVVALGLIVGGCGGGSTSSTTAGSAPPPAFSWLRPGPAPSDWRGARIATGAVLYYPAHWRRFVTDPGTVTAVLADPRGQFLGYLNLTPRQGGESLANWPSFRVDHNGDEGDRQVVTLAVASGLHFRNGRGDCVRDSYATRTGNRFIEVACLVAGPKASSVVVAAAPPRAWAQLAPTLEQAISSFTT